MLMEGGAVHAGGAASPLQLCGARWCAGNE
jgi:hypothetical protein